MKNNIYILGTILLSIAIEVSISSAPCTPTLYVESGPVYLPGAPLAEDGAVCKVIGPHTYYKTVPESCKPQCLQREEIGPAYHLRVEGRVLNENCEGIEGATIEVFHTDSGGAYSYFTDLSHRGCWGSVKSGPKGDYFFITWKPGSYGVLAGLLPFDLPPYLPQHIHIAVYKPGYKLLSTQLTFADDKAIDWDIRDIMGGTLHANDSRLVLTEEKSKMPYSDGIPVNISKFQFVLSEDPTNTPPKLQIFRNFCEGPAPNPIALCYPKIYNFIFMFGSFSSVPIILGIPIMSIIIVISIIAKIVCCVFGCNKAEVKATKTIKTSPKKKQKPE